MTTQMALVFYLSGAVSALLAGIVWAGYRRDEGLVAFSFFLCVAWPVALALVAIWLVLSAPYKFGRYLRERKSRRETQQRRVTMSGQVRVER